MAETAQKETLGFQTEVKQLLDLVTHSLYSNKEIFLRELISNASDAADKLRFEALSNNELYENQSELYVRVEFNKEARTLTVSDNGIGMTRQEVIDNLGTIARSGTAEFLKSLTHDQAKDSQLIGQFGVGFYSAFIVADRVEVLTRRAGVPASEAVHWESEGTGEFTIETAEKADRGTSIILHLKEDAEEFLEDWRLRNVITKYSDHLSFPVQMEKLPEPPVPSDDDEENNISDAEIIDENAAPEYEVVNKATALWTMAKSDIDDAGYQEFYKHISHDFENPLTWAHNKVEGKLEYTSLLYIPSHAPFDLWNRDTPRGLKLYVQRVFIMDNAEQLLPLYLRFVKGVVDSNDLPLNVSRELLQNNAVIEKIKAATIKRSLSMIEKLTDDEAQYQTFWKAFGNVLKEGPAEDYANREQIAKLLRFASTHNHSDEQTVSLQAYIERMQPEQDKIYYITAENYAAAKGSPHLEIFNQKGIEVLLLTDRIDEWLVSHLTEFGGKQLVSIAKGDLDLGKLENEEEKQAKEKIETEFTDYITAVKEALGDKVKEVKITHRLTASPSCVVVDSADMSNNIRRMLEAAGQAVPESKPILEVNPNHPLVEKHKTLQGQGNFQSWSELLLEQAIIAEGGHLEDPASFVTRLNELLLAK